MSYQCKSIVKAIREVKRLLIEEHSDRVIFFEHKLSGTCFVYTNTSAMEWMLEQLFLGYSDMSPEEFIDQCKVISYVPRTDVENFGALYTKFRPSLFSKEFYRGRLSLKPEYSVVFTINHQNE